MPEVYTPIIKIIEGSAIPKPEPNQNTDDIIPARYLKEITFAKMGEYVFYDERFKNGKLVPEHPFNDMLYDEGGKILVAGANFGCGSSREHAPQALKRFGIDAIIAESFAEIFAGNCASIGLVGVTTSKDAVDWIINTIRKEPYNIWKIDLENKRIHYDAAHIINLDIPEGRRQSFLDGTWDLMSVLQKNEAGIKKVEQRFSYPLR